MNDCSYAFHYRDIDSTETYARRAYEQAGSYDEGRAEALNNLAFVRLVQMRYDEARRLLDSVPLVTDNQLERLVACIQQMRLCQRRSHNRAFYDYREQALRALHRIDEERQGLTARHRDRLLYAESELAIVTSTYYYYIGLEHEAAEALLAMPHEVERDTAQLLNYLYNIGAGDIVEGSSKEVVIQTEFDYLMRCYQLARKTGMHYFEANALEALAEHMIDTAVARRLTADNMPAMKYLHPHPLADDRLSVCLADDALSIFTDYGDIYQIAGANRTLASCYLALGDYEMALDYLEQALADTTVNQAPDLVASIREQLSVAYAALDNKQQSDANRNVYLDLQEKTRQDRSLEARAGQLEQSVRQLNYLLWAVGASVVTLTLLLVLFYATYRQKAKKRDDQQWLERQEELQEELALARQLVEKGQRQHLEQRAKVSMVNSVTPFIDRIIHETRRLDEPNREERLDYIRELTDKINEQTQLLTKWIQLRQGQLTLHIETFPLQQLFDFVAKSRLSFRQKGIVLSVEPTSALVKADRVLTLFMLNTLADNARKFTPEGGQVAITAVESESYVEISVNDTGVGLDTEQLEHVFDHKIDGGHGFGLLNCKGIIEKYRKISHIFDVCLLSAESTKGQGSRFFFRLPKGIRPPGDSVMKSAVALIWGALFTAVSMPSVAQSFDPLAKASIYADSAYFSNINGTYERTLQFADSCRTYLNAYYRQQQPQSTDTMLALADPSVTSPEITWFRDRISINFDIVLDIRNESAVAALAIHHWPLYYYNNRIYTQLFKELSADQSLPDYCRMMQQSEANKTIAVILLALLFVLILAAVFWQVLVMLNQSARRREQLDAQLETMEDELQRLHMEVDSLHVANAVLDNCLSALKHETMYYPSRIRQLVDSGDTASLSEVTDYYRQLYGILSLQAIRQVEHTKLHLRHLEHDILGDPVLIDYLFELLRKQSGQSALKVDYMPKDDKYVVCTVFMEGLTLTEEQAATLCTPVSADNIPYLLCRQIVRDHGEATNRRGCAISAQITGGVVTILITLPRARCA